MLGNKFNYLSVYLIKVKVILNTTNNIVNVKAIINSHGDDEL